MPGFSGPAQQRRYANTASGETIVVDVQERPGVTGEGHLYVELTIEALEMILDRAGFTRADS